MDKLSRELKRLSLMNYQKNEQTVASLIRTINQNDRLIQSLIINEVEIALKRDLNEVISNKEAIRLGKAYQSVLNKFPEIKEELATEFTFPRYYQSKDAFEFAISTHLTDYTLTNQALLEDALIKSYQRNYLLTAYQIQKGVGAYQTIEAYSPFYVAQIVKQPWIGHENFISRFSKNKDQTIKALSEIFKRGVEENISIEGMRKLIQNRLEMTSRQAKRLVYTEASHIFAQATADSYSFHNVEEYEILATLDNRTSDICQAEDGRRYRVSERQTGINYPPFHPYCRTTTVPVIDSKIDGERMRWSKNEAGEREIVKNLTYREWERVYFKA